MSKIKTLFSLGLAAAFLMSSTPNAQLSRAETQAGFPPSNIKIGFESIASDLTRPVFVTHAGDARLFVVEQNGKIKIIQNGSVLPTPFLDISALLPSLNGYSEEGLLGLAFEPSYATTGRFYIYYNNKNSEIELARYTVSGNPNVANPTGTILLAHRHPFGNHNGGWLGFGPDGKLFVSVGDGGSGSDPECNGVKLNTLLGKMLRLNVTGQISYTIPSDNPFVNTAGARGEIWAFGLRNAWRNSFDRATGEFYIADVGQNLWEEVNVVPGSSGGLNFGWALREGRHNFVNPNNCVANAIPATEPVEDYPHNGDYGASITGGYVYRGQRFPHLRGVYFFGDYGSNRIWEMRKNGSAFVTKEVDQTDYKITSFGEDVNGELYIAHYDYNTPNAGGVLRLVSYAAFAPAVRK